MRSGFYVPIGTLAALSAPSDPDLVEIDSRGLPADALEWADTTASEVIRQPGRNCAAV
jgi:hypothetical protein